MGFLGAAWTIIGGAFGKALRFLLSRPWYQLVMLALVVTLVLLHLSHGRQVRSLQADIAKKSAIISVRDLTIANYRTALTTSEASVRTLRTAVDQQNAEIASLNVESEKARRAALEAVKAADAASAKARANIALLRAAKDQAEDCRAPAAHLQVMNDL